ncbi:MAG: FitA-like ribbon-helix-helix domain-containing protein [Rhodospirillales bacterium]
MATLTIRNLDDDVALRLKEEAKRNGRSVEAEVRQLLIQRFPHQRRTREEAIAAIERFAEKTKGVEHTDSVLLLREDRDR